MRIRDARSLTAFCVAEGLWGFAWTLAIEHPVPATLGKALGTDSGLVGWLMLGSSVALGFTILFSPWILAPLPRKRGLVFWGHLLPALFLGAFALLIHATGTVVWMGPVYIGATTLFFLLLGMQGPAWFALMGGLFPEAQRARAMGITFTVNRAGGVLGGILSETILSQAWSGGDRWGLVFGIAAGAMIVGSAPYLWVREPARVPRPRPRIRRYLGEMREALRSRPVLRRFLYLDMVAVFAFVLVAYYGDAALRLHGAPESSAGYFGRTTALAQVGFATLVAVVGARVAPRHWLIVTNGSVGAAAVLAAFAPGVGAFTAVAACCGVYLVSRIVCLAPQVFRLVPGEDGTVAMALQGVLTIPLIGVFSFGAGKALEAGLSYRAAFLAVAGTSLVVCLGLAFRTPDQGPKPTEATEPAAS